MTIKNKIIQGDALEVLKTLPDESVDCVITSPPYWALRDYGVLGQLGLESTFQEYISKLCNIFNEVKRVLKKEGTCWVNMGDTYGGTGDKADYKDPKYERGRNGQSKAVNKGATSKCLLQIPNRFAIEMCARGWLLRNEIIWHKPNVMPSSAIDRFTVDFEKVFFFTKNRKYHFETQFEKAIWAHDNRATKGRLHYENGKRDGKKGLGQENFVSIKQERNKRTVWKISTTKFKEAHFATFPEALIETPIKAGCPQGGVVLDPFFGAGTTGLVARKLDRHYLGIELNPAYIKIAEERLKEVEGKLW